MTEEASQEPDEPSLAGGLSARVVRIGVVAMLLTSSMFMALAWIGHLRFRQWPFLQAFLVCWLLVLPEYVLNVIAIRRGYGTLSGAQMAAFRLCSGVVWIGLVARFVLDESLSTRQIAGFGLMLVALLLVAFPGRAAATDRAGGEGV